MGHYFLDTQYVYQLNMTAVSNPFLYIECFAEIEYSQAYILCKKIKI